MLSARIYWYLVYIMVNSKILQFRVIIMSQIYFYASRYKIINNIFNYLICDLKNENSSYFRCYSCRFFHKIYRLFFQKIIWFIWFIHYWVTNYFENLKIHITDKLNLIYFIILNIQTIDIIKTFFGVMKGFAQ